MINLSPESFYSGSVVNGEDDLVLRVNEMIEQGADFLDIGGASTAPKNFYETKAITPDDELSRVSSAMETMAPHSGAIPWSALLPTP